MIMACCASALHLILTAGICHGMHSSTLVPLVYVVALLRHCVNFGILLLRSEAGSLQLSGWQGREALRSIGEIKLKS